ncbi:MAG: hypothetical protein LH478_13355 [Chitinophagaceae bacterium]|nr:hypothetical protein [Chitinophagaceae bacterium]
MKVKAILRSGILASSILLLSNVAMAQVPGGPGPDPDPNGTGVPLDLGLSLFIAAGVGYAAKKRMDMKKGRPGNDLPKD